MSRAIIFALLLVTLPAVASAQSNQAPALALKDLRGRTVRVSDYKGKVVLLNFWATWCPPCRAEMPDLVKWQREFRDKGLRVIGVTYPPTKIADVRRFIRSIHVNYPILLGTKGSKELFDAGEIMPMTVVIDSEGNIRDRVEGILFEEEFERKVKPLLR